MNSEKSYHAVELTDINIWGFSLLNKTLNKYLNESVEATSSRYFHTVLITFAVEALTDTGNLEGMHLNWLQDGYSQAIDGYKTPDYQSRIEYLWNEYQREVKSLVSKHIDIDPSKAYTCTIQDKNTMVVNSISIEEIKSNDIIEIF